MITRTKTLPAEKILIEHVPQGTWIGQQPDPIVTVAVVPPIETVFEMISSKNSSAKGRWTNLDHYSRRFHPSTKQRGLWLAANVYPNTGNTYWAAKLDVRYRWESHGGLGAAMPSETLYVLGSERFIPAPANLDSLLDRGLRAMMPGVKDEMSLVNSVVELRDFKSLCTSAVKQVALARRVMQHLPSKYWGNWTLAAIKNGWNQYIRSLKNRSGNDWSARAMAKTAAGHFLQWKFAWQPLMRDVSALQKAIRDTAGQVNKLIDGEGKIRTRHWSSAVEGINPTSKSGVFTLGMNPVAISRSAVRINAQSSDTGSTFHVELKYNYHFSAWQKEHKNMLGLLDALGVNSNPAILWNAVKYTFILDWVLGVGRYLDQFKRPLMEPLVNIHGALWSVSWNRRTEWSKTYFDDILGQEVRVVMPAIEETAYGRHLFMPGKSSLTTSGLTSSEVILGGALLVARSRRK